VDILLDLLSGSSLLLLLLLGLLSSLEEGVSSPDSMLERSLVLWLRGGRLSCLFSGTLVVDTDLRKVNKRRDVDISMV